MFIGADTPSPAAHHTKDCSKCGEDKPIAAFSKHPTSRFGVASICKECRVVYRKEYYQKNKEKEAAHNVNWSKNNLHIKRASRAKRRTLLLSATPKWANLILIQKFYSEADFLTKVTGIKYEVDHVIPLQGKNVCGLHVANNLQVIKMVDNRSKAAKYRDEI